MKSLDMTCPRCGAKLTVDTKHQKYICDYCGTEYSMDSVESSSFSEAVNTSSDSYNPTPSVSAGTCPKCGSSKIKYMRESENERGYHKTTAMCQSCGHTWTTASDIANEKKKKGACGTCSLWVLGWLIMFPIPVTIIMLKNEKVREKLDKKIRYGIIVAAWVIYLLIGLFGNSSNDSTVASSGSTEASSISETVSADNSEMAATSTTDKTLSGTPSDNPLINAEVKTADVLNGSRDTVIGTRAYIEVTQDIFDAITPEELFEFAQVQVEGQNYNWFTIISPSKEGILFYGSNIQVLGRGFVDNEGEITEKEGDYIIGDNTYFYMTIAEEEAEDAAREAEATTSDNNE